MRAWLASGLIGAAVMATGASATGAASRTPPPARVTVSPRAGRPQTSFTVAFTAPERSGRAGSMVRSYQVSVSGTGRSCGEGEAAFVPVVRRGQRVHVELGPPERSGWCTALYHGVVQEMASPYCAPGRACPQYIVVLRTLGRFRFRVRPSGDTTAPEFAGLKSATACTPGPQRPGQTTPFHLRWDAARDDVTPTAQIVYDIFESSTAGGEDFAQPTWTTTPGATSFTTPGLPSHGSVYFVVRARDRAGNEDANMVERRGVDPCLAADSTPVDVKVSPRVGGPHTTFTVSFTAPERTGHAGVYDRSYMVSAQGSGTGCGQAVGRTADASRRGQRLHVTFAPDRGSGWCVATYRGTVDEIVGPYCVRGQPCPEFPTRQITLGRFGFRVRARG